MASGQELRPRKGNFGATARTRYTADMEYLPESKTWRALDVKFDQ